MNKIRMWALAAVCVFCAMAIPAISADAGGSAGGLVTFLHWANIYEVNNGWGASYNGYVPGRVRQTGDGGFAIGLTKWHDSASDGGEEMGVMKLNSTGDVLWAVTPLATMGDDGQSRVEGLAQLSDGRIAELGWYYDSYDAPNAYVVVMVLGPDGTFRWMKSFLSTFDPRGRFDLQPLKGGGMIVAAPLAQGYWVAKLNASGKIAWQTRLDACINAIQQTSDGGFIAVGTGAGDPSDAWIAKFNSLGAISWQRSCGDPAFSDTFNRVAVMGDGYIAAGDTAGFGATTWDGWLVKFDFQGHIRWQWALSTSGTNPWGALKSVARLREGGVVLCGVAGDDEHGGRDFILKLNSAGVPVWSRYFQASIADVIQTRLGDYVLIGESISGGSCYPVASPNRSFFFSARVDALGEIGPDCCLIGATNLVTLKTTAVPYNTHYLMYHSPATVRNLAQNNPGFFPVDVTPICQADLK